MHLYIHLWDTENSPFIYEICTYIFICEIQKILFSYMKYTYIFLCEIYFHTWNMHLYFHLWNKENFIFQFYFFTLQYCIGFAIHWHESATGVHVFPILNPAPNLPPHPIPLAHPSAPAPSMLYQASKLDWRFVSHMIIYMFQMPFSHIIPPSPSPTESKKLFYTSVSLLLSLIQGYHYHLSKFHIYALEYCIGVFLSNWLHSV